MSCNCNEPTRSYYTYYDTPDGCDVLKKTIVTTRYAAITALAFSTIDVLFYSHAVGVIPVLKRYVYHMVPLGLMGATFSVVANGALHFRQKDGPINYLLGGLACGPILGAYLRSGHAVLLGGLFMGVIGMLKKDAVDHNYTILPPPPAHMGSVWKWRHDYTLRADPLDEMRHTCGDEE
ncbi:unnamed protein product, partial [Iphiclides podalirius]